MRVLAVIFFLLSFSFKGYSQKPTDGCISGDCQNGVGVFIKLVEFKNPSNNEDYSGRYHDSVKIIYKGEFKNGMKNGKGVQTKVSPRGYHNIRLTTENLDYSMEDSSIYIGQFINDKQEGLGREYRCILKDYNMGIKYENIYTGEWKNGVKNGVGQDTIIFHASYEGLKNFTLEIDFYKGLFQNDKRSGIGKKIYNWIVVDESRNYHRLKDYSEYYEGEWKDGKLNGFGAKISPVGKLQKFLPLNYFREPNDNWNINNLPPDSVPGKGYNSFIGEWLNGESVGRWTKPNPLLTTPKPIAPANLMVSNITFSDTGGNNNNILDVGEDGYIIFTLSNKGKGDAYDVYIYLLEFKSDTIDFEFWVGSHFIKSLRSGNDTTIKFDISSYKKQQTGKRKYNVIIKEANGFDADPFNVVINTEALKTPKLVIADASFTNKDGDGKIQLGHNANLELIIQNQGQGEASNIKVKFQNPDNVFSVDATEFSIASLKPNETKHITYEFLTNKRYTGSNIPIQVSVSESYGKYGITESKSVSLEQTLAKTQDIEIQGQQQESNINIIQASLFAEVDKNIVGTNHVNPNRFALIIGNEDYSTYQSGLSNEANVDFARNDARIFEKYCKQIMGVPAENIKLFTDVTAGKMKQEIERINRLIKNSDGKLEIIFYYAGHGMPDENTHESYLIPVDVSGSNLQNAVKLSDVYHSLSEYPSAKVSVFLDACFSGGGRNQGLLAARTVKVKPREDFLKGNMVVFAASSGDQTSLPYKQKQHGMFTYFLLKKLQETKGDISYKELSEYINQKVSFESVNKNNKEQNPQTNVSDDVKDKWSGWRVD
jgi:hypothetical protein